MYEVDLAAGDGLIAFVYVGRGGRDSVMISLLVTARLNTRTSLIEPEKRLSGVMPFQPRRRVEVDEDAEMAYVRDADAYVDPSM